MSGDTLTDFFGDVIHAYTRADAIRDGVLVELPTNICREAGIVVPVAVTARVWSLVAPDNIDEMPCQSVEGRLWDLLWMFTCTARASKGMHRSTIHFKCTFLVSRTAPGGVVLTEHQTETLRATCGPGDDGEPVITIMLPGED